MFLFTKTKILKYTALSAAFLLSANANSMFTVNLSAAYIDGTPIERSVPIAEYIQSRIAYQGETVTVFSRIRDSYAPGATMEFTSFGSTENITACSVSPFLATPFFCPADRTVGNSADFYLSRNMSLAFARGTTAHEAGHAVAFKRENFSRIGPHREAELLADCIAGAYAKQHGDKEIMRSFITNIDKVLGPSGQFLPTISIAEREIAFRDGYNSGNIQACLDSQDYQFD